MGFLGRLGGLMPSQQTGRWVPRQAGLEREHRPPGLAGRPCTLITAPRPQSGSGRALAGSSETPDNKGQGRQRAVPIVNTTLVGWRADCGMWWLL